MMLFCYVLLYLLLLFFVFVDKLRFEKHVLNISTQILFVSLLVFLMLKDENNSRDTLSYMMSYKRIDTSSFFNNLVEPGYFFTAKVLNYFKFGSYALFFVFGFLGLLIKFKTIKLLSNLFVLSLIIYFSNYYLLHEFTQIRVAISSGLLLLSVCYLFDNRKQYFVFVVLIATLFHYSSMAILILLLFDSKKINVSRFSVIIPISYLFYYLKISISTVISLVPVPFVQIKYQLYKDVFENGAISNVNIFNLFQVIRVIIVYLILFNIEYFTIKNKYVVILVKIYILSSSALVLFSDFPPLAFRLSELFGIVEVILIPMLIYLFKPEKLAILVCLLVSFIFVFINVFYLKLVIFI